METLEHAFRVPLESRSNGRGENPLRVHDQLRLPVHKGKVSEGFDELEGYNHIGCAILDEGGKHLSAVAEVGNHGPATLGHAVHLALFHVEPRCEKRQGGQFARQEDSLAPHAAEDDVTFPLHFPPPLR